MNNGQDLIFATGAPGSKWSRILTTLGLHPQINNTDKDKFPKYNLLTKMASGRTVPVGNHSGAYFGPGNGYGEKFYDLTTLSKQEFLDEISKVFDNFTTGIKIVKSHWFSYGKNLEWLQENFPQAKIILIYNGDDIAFKWWHFVGGWDISFPTYTWYQNDKNMFNKILEENKGILDFASNNLIPLKIFTSFQEFLKELDLDTSTDFVDNLDEESIQLIDRLSSETNLKDQINGSVRGAAIGILAASAGKSTDLANFNTTFKQSCQFINHRHKMLQVDELLEARYGQEWMQRINNIAKLAI